MKVYSLFIGRWQPWHAGHQWLIDQRLKEGKNVCIAIRDVETDDNQPWQAEEIKGLLIDRFDKDLMDFVLKRLKMDYYFIAILARTTNFYRKCIIIDKIERNLHTNYMGS